MQTLVTLAALILGMEIPRAWVSWDRVGPGFSRVTARSEIHKCLRTPSSQVIPEAASLYIISEVMKMPSTQAQAVRVVHA